MASHYEGARPAPDKVLTDIADYVLDYKVDSPLAFETARNCLIDTLGCGLEALEYPACTKLLGPLVPGMTTERGAKVPGTPYQLDPVQAAFNIGTMIRWLDFNDTWLAAEWGHPSDNLGGILAVADWLSRNGKPLSMRDVLAAMIKAHEIQGVIALENSFNKVGLDHVILVKVASTAVVSHLLDLPRDRIINALSQAFVDGQAHAHLSPRAQHRFAQELGRRRCDQPRRAPRAHQRDRRDGLSVGSHRAHLGLLRRAVQGQAVPLPAPLRLVCDGERAVQDFLSGRVPRPDRRRSRHDAASDAQDDGPQRRTTSRSIIIRTHEACIRIIDKKGPLANPADRDHCIQYMVAVPLIFGRLTAKDYEDEIAADPRIDALRDKITCIEDPQFTRDYHDPDKRSIANGLTVKLKDGTTLAEIVVEYPIGHKRRRAEGIPLLVEKFRTNLARRFDRAQQQAILDVSLDQTRLEAMSVNDYVDLYAV